jgi:hypothetical protein
MCVTERAKQEERRRHWSGNRDGDDEGAPPASEERGRIIAAVRVPAMRPSVRRDRRWPGVKTPIGQELDLEPPSGAEARSSGASP